MNKLGRNDPCSCGSGKKFKLCCMARAQGAAAPLCGESRADARIDARFDVRTALQAGLEHHQAGRFPQAEHCYRQVLGADPANVDALHFLGVLAHQINRHAQAAELIAQSVRLDASNPNAHNNLGDAYRVLGRFDDALASFQKALALQPDFHEVRNNMGETYRAMGRFIEATGCFHEVLKHKPEYAVTHNNLGLTLQALGDSNAAIDCFRQALALDPNYWNAHNNLGEAFRRLDRTDDARACYQKALALNPDFAEAHNNLGLLLRCQGKWTEAQAAFEKALALRPDFAEVHSNLGMLFKDQGKAKEALAHFDQALKLKPELAHVHYSFAAICKEQGYTEQALISCQAALRIQPMENAYWVLFSEIVKLLPGHALDRVDIPALLAALKKDEVDAQNLERIAVALVLKNPLVERWCAAAQDHAALSWEQFCSDSGFMSFIEMPLLLAVLEETIITDYRLEKLLTRIRREMLGAAPQIKNVNVDASLARFAASLAQQCFANEYIFGVSAEEALWQATLAENIASALQKELAFPAAWLMLSGAYQALYRLGCARQLRPEDWQEDHVRQVLKRQLSEPVREEALKLHIPRLTSVDNEVSQAVRQQYEESPYPRWRKRGKSGDGQPLHAVLRKLFPQQKLPDTSPDHLQVLVAGCGTGYHSIRASQRFDKADILAVDLSLSSLAYAQRATEESGIGNIDYRQADILELADLNRQFDVIESCGVLHHMADPMAGWKILTDLLRPGAYMFIGLYSERARRQVSALRRLIVERGYPASTDGIRRFRADALSGAHDIVIGDLAASPDFNSTSACRDLLFHVQEHLFTPLRIQAHLDQLGLKFLGFDLPYPEVKRRYAARFPENAACDSLAHWDVLEQDFPHAFSGMYQFWARKE